MSKEPSAGEILLGMHLKELRLDFVRDFQFSSDRKWTADFCVLKHKILIECEGATGYFKNPKGEIVLSGRHNKEKGFADDCVKYNTAQMLGYKVLRWSSKQIGQGIAKDFLKLWLVDERKIP